jgi:hypothetical protein
MAFRKRSIAFPLTFVNGVEKLIKSKYLTARPLRPMKPKRMAIYLCATTNVNWNLIWSLHARQLLRVWILIRALLSDLLKRQLSHFTPILFLHERGAKSITDRCWDC